jgi:hypothetical protein
MRLLKLMSPNILRHRPSGRVLGWVLAFVLIGTLEMLGRFLQADYQDLGCLLCLLSAFVMVVSRSKSQLRPAQQWFQGKTSALQAHLQSNVGIDFRGTPAYPTRAPAIVWGVFLSLLTWAAVSSAVWWLLPMGWRQIGWWSSYTLYLGFTSLIWVGLLGQVILCVSLMFFLIETELTDAIKDRADRKTILYSSLMFYIAVSILCVALVPVGVVLILIVAMAFFSFVKCLVGQHSDTSFLWRSAPGRSIYSIPKERLAWGVLGFLFFLGANLILTACGGRLLQTISVEDPAFISLLLGSFAAWLTPGAMAMCLYSFWSVRQIEPSRNSPLGLALVDSTNPQALPQAEKLLRQQGFDPYIADSVESRSHMRLSLVPEDQSEALDFQPTWPLKVSLKDLNHPEFLFRIRRRDELRLRRAAYRGMRRLLRYVMKSKRRKGGAYYLSPHNWLSDSMSYDQPQRGQDEPASPTPIGPSYSDVFHPRVRQLLYRVLRGLEIDIILIEDGIKPNTVLAVMRQLFQHHDRNPGLPLDEMNLPMVQSARIVIHDCQPDQPRQDKIAIHVGEGEEYDENDYLSMSRYRILHIFKDDSESESLSQDPVDVFWQPSPSRTPG